MCVMSFLAVVVYCIVDVLVDRRETKTEHIEAMVQQLFDSDASESDEAMSDSRSLDDRFEDEIRNETPEMQSIHNFPSVHIILVSDIARISLFCIVECRSILMKRNNRCC
jgi:hypothetical protein